MFFIKRLLIFFGGKSTEHDISVITGVLALNCVNTEDYVPVGVYVTKTGEWYGGNEYLKDLNFFKSPDLKKLTRLTLLCGDNRLYEVKRGKLKFKCFADVALSCMHGINGEDGALIGALRLSGVAVASPDMFASSAAIDKDYTKLISKSINLPFVNYVRLKRDCFYDKREKTMEYCAKKIGYPMIVKPARLGSSIGVKKVETPAELELALTSAFTYDDKAVCEKYIASAEDVNVAAYYSKGKIYVSRVEKAFTSHELLTFSDKYGGGKGGMASSYRAPLACNEQTENLIKSYCEKIYRSLDFRGIVRFDFLLVKNAENVRKIAENAETAQENVAKNAPESGGSEKKEDYEIYFNEINAVPGSLAYYLFCDKIKDFSALLTELCRQAEADRRRENNLITEFKSSVLAGNWQNIKK